MEEFKPIKKLSPTGEFVPIKKVPPEKPSSNEPSKSIFSHLFEKYGQPTLEGLGMAGGGLIGSGVGPAGTVVGATLGYGIGKKTGEIINRGLSDKKPLPPLSTNEVIGELKQSGEDLKTGAMMEMGGQALGKILPPLVKTALKPIGKVGSELIGKLTGTGGQSLKESYKRSPNYLGSLRNEITGEEVVDMAKSALTSLKDQRAAAYQDSLRKISGTGLAIPGQSQSLTINPDPIARKLVDLANQYRIGLRINQQGKYIIDTSQAAMGKAGRNDIEGIIKEVGEWNDFSPLGLDALKRRVADFYSDSSAARQFTTSIGKTIKQTIIDDVPEYAKMTKGYEQASRLINDIGQDLMMKKEGIMGRVTADKTLRRLISSMKENFELRNDLVQILGNKGGEDLSGAISGYAMKTWMPRGMAGVAGLGFGANVLLAKVVNPAFWPLVALSSPRVAGEFISTLGRFSGKSDVITKPLARALAYGAGKKGEAKRDLSKLPDLRK
uniref:Uncharacterized protein n=1 Tax=viral metagenome TaxID=1070528 RepID=A0A6M3KZ72_9ZZZZ